MREYAQIQQTHQQEADLYIMETLIKNLHTGSRRINS